ncbi:hypothetical protein [Metaclostridioides mangenotii]|uniref:hypothetical protein n=1 Tax=Metaclostridioides mangenotii TaxID=1540 RepID=UPI000A7289F3|nr:hypothetical protein [Clostridioides mangenotii]
MSTNKESTENGVKFLKKKKFDTEKFKSKYTIESLKIKSTYDGYMIPAEKHIHIPGQ